MKKLILVSILALSLTGCVRLQEGVQSVGQTLCDNESVARAALQLALRATSLIYDNATREASVAAIQASIEALSACPESL